MRREDGQKGLAYLTFLNHLLWRFWTRKKQKSVKMVKGDQFSAGSFEIPVRYITFSSPEAAILLFSTKNQDLWPVPIFEHAQKILSIIFNQSYLSDLTMSPWIADFGSWERPEVSILGADQRDRGLWGREWIYQDLHKSCFERQLWFIL